MAKRVRDFLLRTSDLEPDMRHPPTSIRALAGTVEEARALMQLTPVEAFTAGPAEA